MVFRKSLLILCLSISLISFYASGSAEAKSLLNVSYDPTRELFNDYNTLFVKHWKRKTGEDITVEQSHGGSGKQARAVIDGLQADVVTLALAHDIDKIAKTSRLIPLNWQQRLPNKSLPYTSTIVFLVRKGNPKKISDWDDLVKPGVQVVTPNPMTSGGARWNYLAAYGYALKKFNNNEVKAKSFVKSIYTNAPILDTGARGSTTTFVKRNIGDVLLSWESEAYLVKDKLGKDKFEIIYPSLSIQAEPPVSVIDKVAHKKGNFAAAREYLAYLYSKEAQEIIAKHYFRPMNANVAKQYASTFPTLPLITIESFGGWKATQAKHFDKGGVFDQISKK